MSTAPASTRARVLVLDDRADRRAATAATIAAAGAAPIEAGSLDAACEALRREGVALACLEAGACSDDVLDLAGRLQAEAGTRSLPSIVLSDGPADGARLLRGPAPLDWLQRPFEPLLLAAKVRFVLAAAGEVRHPGRREDRARQLLRLNERMVAGLVHDLRTPLMAINLSAEVALARSSDDAVQQAARRIRSSSTRMSRIFDHLLNLSRIGTDAEVVDLAPADLRDVAGQALDEMRRAHPAARFDVAEEGEFEGVFDAVRIGRTLGRLLETALAHVGPGDPVTVRLDGQHRDRLFATVSIPGVIPAEAQERMFVPGPKTPGLEIPGLGLGLDAVDGLVRAHGGSLVGRSRTPEGTVFELLLPRDAVGSN